MQIMMMADRKHEFVDFRFVITILYQNSYCFGEKGRKRNASAKYKCGIVFQFSISDKV